MFGFRRGVRFFSADAAADTLNFGRYRGQPFAHVPQHDPKYCEWVLNEAKRNQDPGVDLLRFAKWLEDHGHAASIKRALDSANGSTCKVGFGKYKDMSYGVLARQDPEYCEWVLRAAGEGSVPSMVAFKAWLESHPSFSQ
jgi:hypothetical protein